MTVKQMFYKDYFKRILDVFIASILFIVLLPIILVIAVLVKLDSNGNVIFIQKRISINGGTFDMYKFRTMCVNAEHIGTGAYSFENDPRITKLGKILRKLSLDELPQLFNILKGDMSFVGPRPILTYHPCKYDDYTDEEKTIFTVRPGITGWAQVNGRNTVDWVNRFELNKWYVKNISLALDLKIIAKTFIQVISRKETVIKMETAKSFMNRKQKKGLEI